MVCTVLILWKVQKLYNTFLSGLHTLLYFGCPIFGLTWWTCSLLLCLQLHHHTEHSLTCKRQWGTQTATRTSHAQRAMSQRSSTFLHQERYTVKRTRCFKLGSVQTALKVHWIQKDKVFFIVFLVKTTSCFSQCKDGSVCRAQSCCWKPDLRVLTFLKYSHNVT